MAVKHRPAIPTFSYMDLTTPSSYFVGEDIGIKTSIKNIGAKGGSENVKLFVGNKMVNATEMYIESAKVEAVSFSYTPEQLGKHEVKIGGIEKIS